MKKMVDECREREAECSGCPYYDFCDWVMAKNDGKRPLEGISEEEEFRIKKFFKLATEQYKKLTEA